jgi:hypothetical protein
MYLDFKNTLTIFQGRILLLNKYSQIILSINLLHEIITISEGGNKP